MAEALLAISLSRDAQQILEVFESSFNLNTRNRENWTLPTADSILRNKFHLLSGFFLLRPSNDRLPLTSFCFPSINKNKENI